MVCKQLRIILSIVLVIMLSLSIISCGKGETVRKYKAKEKEVIPASKPLTVPGAGTGQTHFQWKTPAGWSEDQTTTGIRLAAFTIKSQHNESTALCTIVPLQGEAGGLKANIERWFGQIRGDAIPPAGTVEQLLKTQESFFTAGQFPAVLIDFTDLTVKPTDITILAAIITVNGNSVFIKMTGEKKLLIENKEKFKELCRSFTR